MLPYCLVKQSALELRTSNANEKHMLPNGNSCKYRPCEREDFQTLSGNERKKNAPKQLRCYHTAWLGAKRIEAEGIEHEWTKEIGGKRTRNTHITSRVKKET